MEGKMGRPVAEDPKKKIVTMRFTQSQHDELKAYAEQHDMTVTQGLWKGWDVVKTQKS